MRIEYEDSSIIVVWKEAGLPVQTARTSGRDLVSMLKNHLAAEAALKPGSGEPDFGEERGHHNSEPYLGIVHRLDQPVEGLLVFAKTPKAAASLSAQAAKKSGTVTHEQKASAGTARGKGFVRGKNVSKSAKGSDAPIMNKTYKAIVNISPEAYPEVVAGMKSEVTLTDWLIRDPVSNMSAVTGQDTKGAKRAELSFRTLEIKGRKAYLEIHLYTGRHHQIRAQLANAGMPLVGDRKYGGAAQTHDMKNEKPPQLCLCSSDLEFTHPVSGKRVSFHVEPTFLAAESTA